MFKKKKKIREKIRKGLKRTIKKSPLRLWFKKEEEYTRKSSHIHLTKADIYGITIMAIISVFLSVFAKIIVFMRWSTFPDNSIFYSWHPWTGVLGILAGFFYIYACKAKGIDFWLVYFPAIFSIVYCLIELAMIHSWLHPEILKGLFGPFADHLPDWLTGGPI